jgi:O-antigen/teichoic acid export membrane protein
LTVLFVQLFNAGLGEAVIVMVGKGRAVLQTAVSATVAALFPVAVVGTVLFLLTGWLVLDVETSNDVLALMVSGASVLLNIFSSTLAWLLVSRERIVLHAFILIVSATTTTAAIYVLVVLVHWGTFGAMLASLLGAGLTLIWLHRSLAREGISFLPAWNWTYLRAAARLGAAVQLSNLLVQMAGRLDLIFVYRIDGSAAAGLYSVSLTLGMLVGSVPMAIAFASFPRLARMEVEEEAQHLVASLFRSGAAASAFFALGLGLASPLVLPLVFGDEYRGAVAPTLLLVPAGVLWSGQWILCRSAMARGEPRPLAVSFTASFVAMVALDLALIGSHGIFGAALASFSSSAVGFIVAVAYYIAARRDWRLLVPRFGDAMLMVRTVRQMLASAWGRRSTQVEDQTPTAPPLSG